MVHKSISDLPGPGNYENLETFGKDAKTFSIRGKPQD
jgi:hypothetical protein